MGVKELIGGFVLRFFITLVVAAVVNLLYGLLVHGTKTVEWDTAIRLALILGIVLTWLEAQQQRRGKG